MASINLAGAIGLGGKRESIISGLPDAINKAGDALNKTIGDELKRQETERAAKREKELQIKEQLKKDITVAIGDDKMHEKDLARLEEKGLNAYAEVISRFNDPNTSWMEKEKIKNKLVSDLKKESKYYAENYQDDQKIADFIDKNRDVIDFNKVNDFFKGDYGSKEETITESPYIAEGKQSDLPNYPNNNPPEEKQWSKTVATPNFPKLQGKEWYDIPYEERVKIAPRLGEKVNELIHVKAGDEIKAVEEFIRAKPTVFVKETTTDGTNKFTIRKDEIAKERTLLKAGMEDPATLPLETYKLYNNFYDRRYKELLDRRFPKEQAIKSAKELASQDMLNNFDKVINRGIEEATNEAKINTEGGGDASTKNKVVMEEVTGTILGDKKATDNARRVQEITKIADEREAKLKDTIAQLEAESKKSGKPISKESLDNVEKTKKAIKSMRDNANIIQNTKNIQEYVAFSQQMNADDKEVTLADDNNQPLSIKPLIVYRDDKGQVRIGGIVKETGTDEAGNKVTKEVAKNVPLNSDNYSTMKVNKKGFDTEYEKTNFAKKSVSSQKGNEKDYGTRNDGVTKKGSGYFGELKMKDGSGKVATELTISPKVNGKTMDIPSLVPTLTEAEKDWLLTNGMKGDDVWEQPIAKSIEKKAIAHAEKRIKEGKSVFAGSEKKVETKKTEPSKGAYKSKSGITFEVK